jgi:NAD(P)-dependent dehydrogenase (short-subunit alcohol dehydrogenase family)
MLADLTGKTALVTGASQGIGHGIALALTRQGARVAITDRKLEWAKAAAAELGGRAIALELDVTDQASVDTAAAAVLARWDGLDILVNNAGVPADPHRPAGRDREEDWDRTFAVNVKGVVRCCEAFVPSMRPRHYGKIINIASMAAHAARRTAGSYAVSKAALLRYTKGLAVTLAPDGINVNAICPGAVWTPFQHADTAPSSATSPSWPPSIRTRRSSAPTATSSPSAGRKHPKTSGTPPPSWHPTTRATSPASASTSTAAPSSAT